MCKTHLLNESGNLSGKLLYWCYFENNAMRCSLFEKTVKERMKMAIIITEYVPILYERKIDADTAGSLTFSSDMIKQSSKQQQAVQSLIFACIHICHQDHSLSSLEPLCVSTSYHCAIHDYVCIDIWEKSHKSIYRERIKAIFQIWIFLRWPAWRLVQLISQRVSWRL